MGMVHYVSAARVRITAVPCHASLNLREADIGVRSSIEALRYPPQRFNARPDPLCYSWCGP